MASVATGEVYCTASHLRQGDGGATNTVMFIRYLDRYACIDGSWAISVRRVVVDWTESHPVDGTVDRRSYGGP